MVNTEQRDSKEKRNANYNILNIVVNTEHAPNSAKSFSNYNILNIVVNTEQAQAVHE